MSLMRMFRDGPEVSLSGSPIVSPITAALCGSDPFGPRRTYLHTGNKGPGKNTGQSLDAKKRPDNQGSQHDKGARRDHLLNGSIGRDLHTGSIIGLGMTLHEARDCVELPADFLHHF
ncbi:catenin alpha-1 [Striga asiatica]|uniref:Catenin alpha-1 n=1 Tax=Striga asiatica TaxID=4170 RepID=A0A5A7QFM2_STRAF|nr:catenin alpha-1 [Striga asiatica]